VLAGLVSDAPTSVEVEVNGPIAAEDTSILKLSALKDVLARSSSDPVWYVNLLTVRSENHEVSGTLIGPSHLPRIVSVDGVGVSDWRAQRAFTHCIATNNLRVSGAVFEGDDWQ